jgi:hypothetical protein
MPRHKAGLLVNIAHIPKKNRRINTAIQPRRRIRTPGSGAIARPRFNSFLLRYALVSQEALVGSAVHQGTAFLTAHAVSGRFDHGDFVFSSAVACMRSGEPFYEFGHARNMRPKSVGFQPVGLPNQTLEAIKLGQSELPFPPKQPVDGANTHQHHCADPRPPTAAAFT